MKSSSRNHHVQRVISRQELVQKPPPLALPLDPDCFILRAKSKAWATGVLPFQLWRVGGRRESSQGAKAPILDSMSQAQKPLQSRPKKFCKENLMGDPSVLPKISQELGR